jgi:hypothetical protein
VFAFACPIMCALASQEGGPASSGKASTSCSGAPSPRGAHYGSRSSSPTANARAMAVAATATGGLTRHVSSTCCGAAAAPAQPALPRPARAIGTGGCSGGGIGSGAASSRRRCAASGHSLGLTLRPSHLSNVSLAWEQQPQPPHQQPLPQPQQQTQSPMLFRNPARASRGSVRSMDGS